MLIVDNGQGRQIKKSNCWPLSAYSAPPAWFGLPLSHESGILALQSSDGFVIGGSYDMRLHNVQLQRVFSSEARKKGSNYQVIINNVCVVLMLFQSLTACLDRDSSVVLGLLLKGASSIRQV